MAERRSVVLVLASTYPRWSGDPEPGFVHELSKRLTDRFRVIVLGPHAPGAKSREVLDGVEVVRYRYAPEQWETLVNDGGIVTNLKLHRWKLLLVPSFVLMQAWWAWRLCRREKVDAIHAHWLIPQGLIAASLQLLPVQKAPYVVTSHGADLFALKGGMLDALKRFVVRRSAAATVVSSAMRGRLSTEEDVARKVSVLPMGVDLSSRFRPDTTVVRSKFEILFVGRLVEKKGVRYLLDALPAVRQHFPDIRLTIAGFGPEEAQLRDQVRRLEIDDQVCFLGAVPQADLPTLYRRAALFVGPFVQAASGDQEGLPVALMEAVACGCPVIAGHVPGIEDLLGEMASEVCVDARDVTTLGAKICDALADPASSQTRARQVFAIAARHVDWGRIANEYAELISQAIAEQRELVER